MADVGWRISDVGNTPNSAVPQHPISAIRHPPFLYVLSRIAFNANRSSLFGSFTTLHSDPKIIVGR